MLSVVCLVVPYASWKLNLNKNWSKQTKKKKKRKRRKEEEK